MKDTEELRETLVRGLSYLVTSAQGLPNEPQIYGPLRLIEGGKIIIEALEQLSGESEDLEKLKTRIDECEELVLINEEKFISCLDTLASEIGTFVAKEIMR